MTESVLATLRRLLIDDYHGLRQRLARRFGSADLASELLHEAWLRLEGGRAGPAPLVVRNPKSYLYRVALNVATDRQRAERSRLATAELAALHERVQDDLDPGRIAEAQQELQALAKAINALPSRRREAFVAARVHELPYKEIAARLGVSVRVVDREISLALETLSDVLRKKNSAIDGGLDDRETS